MTAPDVIPATGVAATSDVYRRRAEDTVRYVEQVLGETLYGQPVPRLRPRPGRGLTRDGRVLPSALDRLSTLRSMGEDLSKAYENLERALVMEEAAAEGEG